MDSITGQTDRSRREAKRKVAFFFQNLTNLHGSSIKIDVDLSDEIGEKEHADLSKWVIILFSSVQSAADHALFHKLRRRPAAQMGVAKPDFSQMCWSRSDLIKNAECFTQIDLD